MIDGCINLPIRDNPVRLANNKIAGRPPYSLWQCSIAANALPSYGIDRVFESHHCYQVNFNGGYRQVVKASGCDSDMREFDSHYLPHICALSSVGSECNATNVEVGGSNPSGRAKP